MGRQWGTEVTVSGCGNIQGAIGNHAPRGARAGTAGGRTVPPFRCADRSSRIAGIEVVAGAGYVVRRGRGVQGLEMVFFLFFLDSITSIRPEKNLGSVKVT